MSDDDYPSDEDLLRIEQWECAWDASGKHPYFAPFFELLKSHWWMPDWGWREYDGSDDGDPVHVYHISTGGWSGNESLLGAMQRNFIVWSLTFNTHRRGGHYEFWIPRAVPCVAPAGSTAEQQTGAVTAAVRPDQLAERIARDAHAGQKDTVTGADYITHVERVVNIVRAAMIGSHLREEAVAVAWLHDVVEDSPITIRDLCRAGFSDVVLDAVERLTRSADNGYSYGEYIDDIRVLGPPLAMLVKIADLQDHLQPHCPERLRPRYERALQALTEPSSAPAVARTDGVVAGHPRASRDSSSHLLESTALPAAPHPARTEE